MQGVTRAVLELLDQGRFGALATVVHSRGSTPQVPGARMLLRDDGTTVGTVGGGKVELHVTAQLNACLANGQGRLLRIDLGRDLGMSCGGSMEIFVEPIRAASRLILCGAGHVAQPTAALAATVGFDVTVVDARPELNSEARFPECRRLTCTAAEAVEELCPTADDWIVLVNYGHAIDLEALEAFGHKSHRYLGLMGSRRKVVRMLRALAERDALPPLDRVYAPIGLELGAVSPAEIAVSIVAELIAVRRGGTAGHMRALDDPQIQKAVGVKSSAP